jgi:hypothetical protein
MTNESLSTGAFVVVVIASVVCAVFERDDHAAMLATVALALLAPAALQPKKKPEVSDGDD